MYSFASLQNNSRNLAKLRQTFFVILRGLLPREPAARGGGGAGRGPREGDHRVDRPLRGRARAAAQGL